MRQHFMVVAFGKTSTHEWYMKKKRLGSRYPLQGHTPNDWKTSHLGLIS
jgi:hypothetical protein